MTTPLARHLTRGKDFLDRNYCAEIGVSDAAQAAGLSPAYFARAFKRSFGETPHRYLLSRRLERAARLLTTTDWSVIRICHSIGLSSVGSFTTSFTRVYGVSPTRYRAAKMPALAHARIPECYIKLYGRPQVGSFREDSVPDGVLG